MHALSWSENVIPWCICSATLCNAAAVSGVANTVGQSSTNAPQPKDFVATIDLTEGSPCFGQIISEADVPTSGNEPHHVGLNQDGTVSVHHQSLAMTSWACTVCRLGPAASHHITSPLHVHVAHFLARKLFCLWHALAVHSQSSHMGPVHVSYRLVAALTLMFSETP